VYFISHSMPIGLYFIIHDLEPFYLIARVSLNVDPKSWRPLPSWNSDIKLRSTRRERRSSNAPCRGVCSQIRDRAPDTSGQCGKHLEAKTEQGSQVTHNSPSQRCSLLDADLVCHSNISADFCLHSKKAENSARLRMKKLQGDKKRSRSGGGRVLD
jgi:hypothetical protein